MSQAPLVKKDLNKPAANVSELRALLTSPAVIAQIQQTIPKHMKAERMAKIMLSACLKTPKLMQVNQLTLLQSLTHLSELGLEPGSAFGHVYLLPFRNNRENRMDVNVIIGYRGYIELMRRSGFVKQIETHVVFEGEQFELQYGLEGTRKFLHVPDWKVPRTAEKALVVYAIVRLKDGAEHVEVMTMDEVRTIRNRSQSWKFKPNEGPWHDDFLEMARKTVIRRAQKYVPMSTEMAEAMEAEHEGEVEGSVVKPDLKALSAGDDLAAQMTASAEAGESVEGEVVDQATGEVVEAQQQAQAPTEDDAAPAGTIDNLLWRVARADAAGLAEIIKEASDLPKDEPRRMEVSAAISARRKAVRS